MVENFCRLNHGGLTITNLLLNMPPSKFITMKKQQVKIYSDI